MDMTPFYQKRAGAALLLAILLGVVSPACALDPAAVEREVEQIRGLDFLRPVDYQRVRREELHSFLERRMDEEIGRRAVGDYARSLAYLGLLPDGCDLRSAYLRLMDEQMTAFYDPRSGALYLFEDLEAGESFARAVLAHELTHALQDQHYDLERYALDDLSNDDRVMAVHALLEGDAMVVMSEVLRRRPMADRDLPKEFPAEADFGDAAIPLFLRESLQFPYLEGRRFVLYRRDRDGDLDGAFRSPPRTTEEILHPERAETESKPGARRVAIPSWRDPDVRAVWRNTLGEFGIRVWLRRWNDDGDWAAPADGWDADRYVYYERAASRPAGLVWVTAWDDAGEAGEFLAAAARATRRMLGVVSGADPTDARIGPWMAGPERVARVWQRGRVVNIVMASSYRDGYELARLAGAAAGKVER